MRNFDLDLVRAHRWAAVRAYAECEEELRREGAIPPSGESRALRRAFEVIGGLEVALVTAGFAIFAVYLIVNFLFHLAL